MSMDRTRPFAQLVAEEVPRALSGAADPVACLKSLGRAWRDVADTIVATGDAVRLDRLVFLAAECQRAAEDLGLCPATAPPEGSGLTARGPLAASDAL